MSAGRNSDGVEERGRNGQRAGRGGRSRRRRGALRQAAAAVFAATALAALAYAFEIRLPAALVDKISALCSGPEFSVEIKSLAFSLRSRIVNVGSAEVYAKGSVDGPLVEAKNAALSFAPKFSKPSADWVRAASVGRLVVSDAIADPDTERLASGGGGRREADFPDFGAIPIFVKSASVCGIDGLSGAAEFSAADGVFRFRGIDAAFANERESMKAEVAYDALGRRISVQCAGDVAPKTMLPLFHALKLPRLQKILAAFDFPEAPPKVAFSLDCALDRRDGEMRVDIGSAAPCSYRGVPVSSFSGVVASSGTNLWRRVEIRDLGLRRPEGSAFGALDINMADRTIAFNGDSRMEPASFIALAHIMEAPPALPVSFPMAPHVKASGVYDFGTGGGADKTSIAGTISAARMDCPRSAFIENISARFFYSGNALKIGQATADAFGGKITGDASIASDSRAFNIAAKLDGLLRAQFPALSDYDIADSKGVINSEFDISGSISTNLMATLRTLTGGGVATAKDANLYRVPLFAGLTGFLSKNIPGVDFLVAQDTLETEFTFAPDGLHLARMEIIGAVFSASAKGLVSYDGDINIRLKGHLMNNKTWVGAGLRYVLFPLSKIFEFRAEGSYKNPKWSSVTF
jgi:hypothetical protein